MSAGISIILVVILLSSVLVTSGRIAEGSKKHELLDNVRVGVAELDILIYDYLLHREERMEQQWHSKYNSLAEILDEEARTLIRDNRGYEDSYILEVWDKNKLKVQLSQELLILMESEARWAIANNLTDKTEVPNYLDYFYFDALEAVNPEAVTIIR